MANTIHINKHGRVPSCFPKQPNNTNIHKPTNISIIVIHQERLIQLIRIDSYLITMCSIFAINIKILLVNNLWVYLWVFHWFVHISLSNSPKFFGYIKKNTNHSPLSHVQYHFLSLFPMHFLMQQNKRYAHTAAHTLYFIILTPFAFV